MLHNKVLNSKSDTAITNKFCYLTLLQDFNDQRDGAPNPVHYFIAPTGTKNRQHLKQCRFNTTLEKALPVTYISTYFEYLRYSEKNLTVRAYFPLKASIHIQIVAEIIRLTNIH
jgi:hypothetical protein